MEIRVTPQVIVDQAIASARRETDQLATLQEQASSGNKLLLPSDDPTATVAVIGAQAQNGRLSTYLGNIQSAQDQLNASNSTLVNFNKVLAQAKQTAVQASNSDNDKTSLEALAEQVDGYLNQLVSLANSQNVGQYLFGGTATNKPPYVITATDSQGRPQSIAYQGASERATVPVGAQESVATLYAGNQIFQQSSRGPTLFTGLTGAAVGTSGPDTATGQGELLVSHTSTTYAAGSGVQPGTNSAVGDTVLGPAGANTLTINDTSGNGTSGTVSLNGGPAVAFTKTATNLQVTGPKGEVVYLDTTAIKPGFNGSVAITANGALSVDGGTTTTPIDFTSSNQTVVDSKTDAVTNVDSRNIRQTGTDNLTYTGADDAFQALINLRDDLRNVHGLTSTQQLQAISGRIADLDRISQGVLQTVGEQGADLQNLDGLQNRVQSLQLSTQTTITDKQGADISQVVIGLTEQQNLLRLTLASVAQVFTPTLLDFLK
jgi:flagellar hook-associated protein 3